MAAKTEKGTKLKKASLPKQLLILSAFVLLSAGTAFAGDELQYDHRVSGDRSMTISVGANAPLFFQDLSGEVNSTNLTFGGTLGLDIDFYLNNNVKLGGGIRGNMAFSPNGRALFLVPLYFNSTYEFKFWPFTVPVSLGAGINFSSISNSMMIDPILIPGTGFYWNLDSTWSFGLNTKYWWIPQMYYAAPYPLSQSRFGNFLELTLSASYHFF